MELKVIPVVQVLIAAVLMVIIAIYTPSLSYHFPFENIVISLLLFLAVLSGVLAIYCFKQHQTTVNPMSPEKASKVVDSGIYAYSRNPMYLALLLVLLTLAVFLNNIATFVIIPLFVAYITRFQIIPEERALTSNFGQDYLRYTKKVRRWL